MLLASSRKDGCGHECKDGNIYQYCTRDTKRLCVNVVIFSILWFIQEPSIGYILKAGCKSSSEEAAQRQ